jgi:5-methylcytosine-specific restriction endonuclease McrA
MSETHKIVLLTHDFQFLNVVTIKKAIKLMVKNRVEVIKSTNTELRSGMFMPKVLRLLKAISVTLNKKIPFSKQSVLIRDNYICQYCGKELHQRNATIDHVLPKAKGGKNSYLNTVCSCKPCNSWKSDSLLSTLNMKLLKNPSHPSFSEFLYLKMKMLGIDFQEIWA